MNLYYYVTVKYHVFFTDRFTQYHLDIPVDRTSVQPNAIVLESQLLPHHFVHWDVPSREVRCQVSQMHNCTAQLITSIV